MTEKIANDVLQRLVPELEAEGYEVFLHPNGPCCRISSEVMFRTRLPAEVTKTWQLKLFASLPS